MGMSAVELVITLEELGRVADPTPFLATTSQYVPRRAGVRRRRPAHGRCSRAVCAGGTGAAAFAAEHRPGPARRRRLGARRHGPHVIDGDRADEVAVVAGTDAGAGVFVVPAGDVAATREPTFDGSFHLADGRPRRRAGRPADRAFTGPGVEAGVERARQEAVAGLAAVMVGASQRVLDLVVAHVRERRQFGVPIGSFQAVKHMAVDVYVAIERARALCHFAALTIAEDDPRRPGGVAGQGGRRRLPAPRRPARRPAVRRARLHLGERPADLRAAGQGGRAAAGLDAPSTGPGPPGWSSPAAATEVA